MGKRCRHFMAVLGTSLYTDCVYEMEKTDFCCRTAYAQLAVLKYMDWKKEPADRISIMLTQKAYEKNWLTRHYTKKELEILAERGIILNPEELKVGLEEILKTAYPGIPLRCIFIKEGRNQEEIDGIFEKIYEEIEPRETICFDFTHGLRNIPMQVLTIINYAKALKEIRVGGMYYGAYELGTKINNELHVNLLDMTPCSVILDWTSAAESFVESGNSAQIFKLYETGKRAGKQNQRKAENAVLKSLYDLTSCISACRGKTADTSENSIRKAYEEFCSNYQWMMESQESMSAAPLSRLFDRIREDLKIFRKRPYVNKDGRRIRLDSTATGLAAIEWAIKKEQTQLGFTALEEVIVTLIGEMYELPAEDQDVREKVIGQPLGYMVHVYGDCKKKQKKSGMTEEELEKTCRQAGLQKALEQEEVFQELCEQEEVRETAEPFLQYCGIVKGMTEQISMELLCLLSSIVQFRNTLNHFGYQKNVMPYKRFQSNLKKWYQELLEIMEREGIVQDEDNDLPVSQ